ncbi:YitT family protein [Peribacillus sp. JNUCC 23]
MYLLEGKKIIIVIIGALFNAIAMNLFLIPANIYASGFTGVAQLISTLLRTYAPFTISTGIILFILNVPITIIAWKKIGRAFTVYSFISVGLMTVFMEVIPVYKMSPDILLNAVFGGVIAAVGVGITLKFGASTGGMDIIAMLLSRVKDKPVGTYLFLLNGVIIVTAGAIYGPEKALYTLVTLYTSTRVIDAIHTRHEKLTAMIITKKGNELKNAIHSKLVRGLTTVPVKGGYTNENKEMILIVVTRYEQYDLEKIINEVDPEAFTNILQTTGIVGLFRKE